MTCLPHNPVPELILLTRTANPNCTSQLIVKSHAHYKTGNPRKYKSEQRPENKSKEKLTCKSYKEIPIKKQNLKTSKQLIQFLKLGSVPYSKKSSSYGLIQHNIIQSKNKIPKYQNPQSTHNTKKKKKREQKEEDQGEKIEKESLAPWAGWMFK